MVMYLMNLKSSESEIQERHIGEKNNKKSGKHLRTTNLLTKLTATPPPPPPPYKVAKSQSDFFVGYIALHLPLYTPGDWNKSVVSVTFSFTQKAILRQ